MEPDARLPLSPAPYLWLAGTSLLLALALGALLRLALAGVPLPFGRFAELRHAHSHLGYYGVLFPLVWAAAAQRGPRPPGRALLAGYGLAVLAATLGFAAEGYGRPAIIASTVVLGVWLHTAVRALPELARPRSWWFPASPSVLVAALSIPAVALNLSRAPALAAELVRLFLVVLLFGLIVPAALAVRRAPAPPMPLWLLGTLGAGLSLGPWPEVPARLGMAMLGGLVLQAGLRLDAAADLRASWGLLGLGLLLLASGLLPNSHAVAIAGLHFAILGPVLLSLGRPLCPRGPRAWCWLYEALVLLLSLGVLGPQLLPGPPWPLLAAGAGIGVGLLWSLAILGRGLRGD